MTPKQRKKLASLKQELIRLEDKAYKMDGNDYDDRPWNQRYEAKVNQIKKLEKQVA